MYPSRWLTVAVFLLQSACSSSRDRPVPAAALDSLVGTWRIIGHVQPNVSDSSAASPWRGYVVYDATGHVFVQVMQRSAADSLTVRRWYELPDSILKEMVRGFRAYFGTYRVDQAAQLVTHHIEGEFLPRAGQAEVATPYRVRGDTLKLGADSAERWVFVRVRR